MHSDAATLQRRCKFQRGAQRRVIPMSGLERLARAKAEAARERAAASLPTVEQCKSGFGVKVDLV